MPVTTTTALVASLAATGLTTGMSFYQANQQRKLQAEAEAKAVEAMADAKKKLEVNYYDTLSIQKEAYNIEKEALLAAGAQSVEAARESERGVGAAAGRIQMAQTDAQRKISAEMGQEMAALDKLSATENARLRDSLASIDIGEVAGAQKAAEDAQSAYAASITQGMQGVQSLASQLYNAAPLYSKTASAKGAEDLLSAATKTGDWQNLSTLGNINGVDFGGVKNYNSIDELKGFLIGLDPEILKIANKTFFSKYNPQNTNFSAVGGS